MKQHIHKELFGRIIMWRAANPDKKVGIIVEAKTDEELYRRMFVEDAYQFFPSNGQENAISVIEKANQQSIKGIISIIDADFRRIENDEPDIENLFMTDCHDAEMMMINSQVVWDSLLNVYADKSKPPSGGLSKLTKFEQTHNQDIKTLILNICKPISCLMLLNHREQLKLKFKNYIKKKGYYRFIDYTKIINLENMSADIDKLIDIVEELSQKQHLFKHRPELKTKLNELMNTKFDLLELCNGHHFINIFVLILKNISNKKATREDIETNLRIAYRPQDFQQTNLYNDLKNWQTAHKPPYHLLN